MWVLDRWLLCKLEKNTNKCEVRSIRDRKIDVSGHCMASEEEKKNETIEMLISSREKNKKEK